MFHINFENLNISFSFRHVRDANFYVNSKNLVTDVTVCDFLVNGQEFSGLAACTAEDKFVKETGRKVALARALKAAGLSREARTYVWGRYLNRGSFKMQHESAELINLEPNEEIN